MKLNRLEQLQEEMVEDASTKVSKTEVQPASKEEEMILDEEEEDIDTPVHEEKEQVYE
jgi:hypothetical protein